MNGSYIVELLTGAAIGWLLATVWILKKRVDALEQASPRAQDDTTP